MNLKQRINHQSFVVVLLSASLVIAACGPKEVAERPEVARPVKMITVGVNAGGETLEVPGSVFAAQSADLAFEVSGQMEARMVDEGQFVKAGDVVAKLDARDYVAQRNRAKAQRDTAKSDYDRYAEAFKGNAVTAQDVSRSKGHLDVTEADLEVAEKALDETQLRAPFGGRIVARLVEDFANVQAKEPVLSLQDESSLELRVDVAERDWVRGDSSIPREELTKIMNPRVQIASLPGREFAGYLKEMSANADPVTRTYRVTLGFEPPEGASVSPGMTGSVIVDRNSREQSGEENLSIPANTITADDVGNPFVWVVDPSSMRVRKQEVQIGELSGSNVKIAGGLSVGDQVITSGVNSLSENMLVRNLNGN
jgi:RND family efflux transporter MFP subunit